MIVSVTVSKDELVKTFNVQVKDGLLPIEMKKSAICALKTKMDKEGNRFAHNAKFMVWAV